MAGWRSLRRSWPRSTWPLPGRGALEVAELAVPDEGGSGALGEGAERAVAGDEVVVVDAGGPVRSERAELRRVDRRVDVDLGDARPQVGQGPFDGTPAPDARHIEKVVGEQHALVAGQLAEREADYPLGRSP